MNIPAKSGTTTRAITREGRRRRRKRKPGPKSSYTKAKGERFLNLMFRENLSVNQACQKPDTPSRRTVYRWLNKHRAFWKSYIRMCEIREMCLTDELLSRTDPRSRKDRRQFNKAVHKVHHLRPKRIEIVRGPWGQRLSVGYEKG